MITSIATENKPSDKETAVKTMREVMTRIDEAFSILELVKDHDSVKDTAIEYAVDGARRLLMNASDALSDQAQIFEGTYHGARLGV
jgi:hypothetical protein